MSIHFYFTTPKVGRLKTLSVLLMITIVPQYSACKKKMEELLTAAKG